MRNYVPASVNTQKKFIIWRWRTVKNFTSLCQAELQLFWDHWDWLNIKGNTCLLCASAYTLFLHDTSGTPIQTLPDAQQSHCGLEAIVHGLISHYKWYHNFKYTLFLNFCFQLQIPSTSDVLKLWYAMYGKQWTCSTCCSWPNADMTQGLTYTVHPVRTSLWGTQHNSQKCVVLFISF